MSAGIATVGVIVGNFVTELAERDPMRLRKIARLTARADELAARRDFHQNPTFENLTNWATSAEKLENQS